MINTLPNPEPHSAYRAVVPITTRWMDNDVYGHVSNVVYYSWFDQAVNGHLITQGALDIHASNTIGLVVKTQCNDFSQIAFPQKVKEGIRVAHVGKSSVRHEVGLFADDEPLTAAKGHFVHVYMSRENRRPTDLPPRVFQALQALQA